MKKNQATRNRPWLLIFSLTTIILMFITFIVFFGFIKFSPPIFQVESISISFDDNEVAKWLISFSFANPNFVTLHFLAIDVSVGGRRPWSSTVASIDQQLLLVQSFHGRSLRNATVFVALPSPRPRLSVDGVDFDVRFRTKYVRPSWRKSVAVVACSDKRVGFSMGGGRAVMVGGPVPCEVVPGSEGY